MKQKGGNMDWRKSRNQGEKLEKIQGEGSTRGKVADGKQVSGMGREGGKVLRKGAKLWVLWGTEEQKKIKVQGESPGEFPQ